MPLAPSIPQLRLRHGTFLGFALLNCLSGACADPKALPAEGGQIRCIDTAQELPSLDSPTPLGVSAQNILDFSVAPRTDTLYWQNEALGGELSFSTAPERGRTQITTEVLPAGTAARWIVSTPEVPTNTPIDAVDCPDRLEIDVTLKAQSSGGALAESIPTTLTATSPHAARIRYISPAEQGLTGGLQLVESSLPGVVLKRIELNMSYTPTAHYGTLRGLAGREDKITTVELASWPKAPLSKESLLVQACLQVKDQFYLPYGETLLGFSDQSVLELINSHSPLHVQSSSGAKSSGTLRLALTQDRTCVSSISELAEARDRHQFGHSGIVHLSLGASETRIPVTVVSNTDDQKITRIVLRSGWNFRRPLRGVLSQKAFEATYGTLGLKMRGYPYYAIYSEIHYNRAQPGGQVKELQGGLQIMGITPRPRSRRGATVDLLGRWDLNG